MAKTMLKNVVNISTCRSKDAYDHIADDIAKKYPHYKVIVDGGPYRGYDCYVELHKDNKEIRLDYYLWQYINVDKCNRFILDYLEENNA